MSFTAPWDESKPAGSRNLNLGDDDIREFKQQVRERADIDGYFPSTDDANTGYHRKATFMSQASDPAQVASALILYAKTVGSYRELFSRHENAALQQLTLNGKLWIQALTMAGLAQGDILYFDGTNITNLGAGTSGYFLKTQGAAANPIWSALSGSYIKGLWRNLKVTTAGAAAVVTLTADEILVDDGAGSVQRFTSVSLTGNMATSGAGGLDTGSENPTTWYYIFLIAKADGTKNLLFSASSSAPTLPSGYTYSALVSAARNDGSSNFLDFTQYGREYRYKTHQTLVSGVNTGLGAWVGVSIAGVVPSALSKMVHVISTVSDALVQYVTNNSAVTAAQGSGPNRIGASAGGINGNQVYGIFDVLTADTIYYESNGVGNILYCAGFNITTLI